MSKALALLLAASSEFLLFIGLVVLTSTVNYVEPTLEKPINVRLSTVPFVYKTEISSSQKKTSAYPYPLVGGGKIETEKNEQSKGAVLQPPQPAISPISVEKHHGLVSPRPFEHSKSNPSIQTPFTGNESTTPTVLEGSSHFEELAFEPPGIAKETILPELVKLESSQQGFRLEDFPNFRQVKAEIKREYVDLLRRRPNARYQLNGKVIALLTLKPDGHVSVEVKESSAIELERIVVANLSKLESPPRRRERTLRVVVTFQN